MVERGTLAACALLALAALRCGGSHTAGSADGSKDTGPGAADGGGGGDDVGADAGLPPRICRTPAPPTGPWFTEVTSEVGLAKTATEEPLANTIVAADLDGDGWQDFFAAVVDPKREPPGTKRDRFLFMNRPDPSDATKRVFVDQMDASGLLATRDGKGGRDVTLIGFADLDNDGDVDAIGCPSAIDNGITDPCAAFLNDGKAHFTLSPETGDLEKDLFTVVSGAMLDYDRDGILDYWPGTIGQWQYGPAPVSRMRLYRGTGDGTFADVAAQAGLPQDLTEPNCAVAPFADCRMVFSVTSCDLEGDGDRDVILAEYSPELGRDHVYLNQGGHFVDQGMQLGVARGPMGFGGFTFGFTCGDLNQDGAVDLFAAELHHAWYPTTDYTEALFGTTPSGTLPLAPYQRPGRAAMGLTRPHTGSQWTEGDSKVLEADFDLDGLTDLDILSVNYPQQSASDPDWTHDWLYQQQPDHAFKDLTSQTPWADKTLQSLGDGALIDIDNDGDLDVITGTGTYNAQFLGLTNTIHVFRNEVGQASNLVRIRLVGLGQGHSNVSGIGARVEATAGGQWQHLEVVGPWGDTQSDVVLTFGLGSACSVDLLVVHWPDSAGTTTTYTNVAANYLVEIHEGAGAVVYKNLDGSSL